MRYKLDLTTMPAAGRRKEEDPLFDLYDDCIAANPYVFGAARPALPFLRSYVDFLGDLPGDPSQVTIRRSSMIGAAAP